MKQEYITPLMGYGLCQQLPVTQGSLSWALPLTNRREKSHTLSWDGRCLPKGNNPHTVTRRVQQFWPEAWCCLKTWCSFDLRLLTHLQDLPGEKSFQRLLGCGDREVLPESSIQAAATVLLQGPWWPGHATWLRFGISWEAAWSKGAQLAPVQFLPSHLCLDRCEVNAKCILASHSTSLLELKVKTIRPSPVLSRLPTAVSIPLAFLRCRQRDLASSGQLFL